MVSAMLVGSGRAHAVLTVLVSTSPAAESMPSTVVYVRFVKRYLPPAL